MEQAKVTIKKLVLKNTAALPMDQVSNYTESITNMIIVNHNKLLGKRIAYWAVPQNNENLIISVKIRKYKVQIDFINTEYDYDYVK